MTRNAKSLNLVPEPGIEPGWTLWVRGILSPLRLPIPPLRHSNGQRATITPVTWGVKIARGKIARGKCRTAWAPTNHRPFGLLRLQEAGYDAAVSIA